MFVRNRTSLQPVLSRSSVAPGIAVACISVELVYDITDDGQLVRSDDTTRHDTDAPDIRDTPLWRGTSVTAFGHAHGPAAAPYVTPVRLDVGDRSMRVIVFGERHWERTAAGLQATAPAPFERLPLSWKLAHGGSVELPPGYLPGTELPYPGGTIAHPLNKDGLGFYPDEQHAERQPLPQIEDPQALISRPDELTVPVGMAPCRELPGLRFDEPLSPTKPTERASDHASPATLIRMLHHAPRPLIFDPWLEPGTRITLEGLGGAALDFTIPIPPLSTAARIQRTNECVLNARLRSLHIDAERRRILASWGYAHRYVPNKPPRWMVCQEAA